MKLLSTFLVLSPFFLNAQYAASLELSMFDYSELIVEINNKQFDACDKFVLNNIQPGEYQLKVFQSKNYYQEQNQGIAKRLIPVYSGPISIYENKCTTCTIDKFHQNNTIIK